MAFIKRIASAVALGAAMLLGFSLFAPPAQATYIVTLLQRGDNVEAAGSGTIDLAGLSLLPSCTQLFSCTSSTAISPEFGAIVTGPAPNEGATTPDLFYTGVTGPTSFGSGHITYANSGSGDSVGTGTAPIGTTIFRILVVPVNYVSGSALSDSMIFDNQTFSALGVTPGTYVWTWGNGVHADSFMLQIGSAAMPEPSSLALLAEALLGLLFVCAPGAQLLLVEDMPLRR